MKDTDLFIDVKLPDPLSKKDFIEYMNEAKKGNKKAREIIIIHNLKLVLNRYVNRFYNVKYEKKDIVAIGIIGLIKAVDSFDILKNIEFATYATRCIDNEILMFLRKLKNQSIEESFENVLNIDKEGNELNLVNTLIDENVDIVLDYENKESIMEIRKHLHILDTREKEFVKLYFGFYNNKTFTQNQIAELYGISRGYVCRIIDGAIKKMRDCLIDESLIDIPIKSHIKVKKK